MSDIRFKISGDTGPFIAEVWTRKELPTDVPTLVATEVVEYSGITIPDTCDYTCAIIGGLNQDTVYDLIIRDSIGNCCTHTMPQTPTNPIITPILLNTELGGEVYSVSNCVKTACGNKQLVFTPPLSTGQCIDVVLDLCGISTPNDNGEAIVYKRCTTSGTYTQIEVAGGDRGERETSVRTNMKPGDGLCYNLTASIVHDISTQSWSCGYADVRLTSVTPVDGFTSCCALTCGPQTSLVAKVTCCTTTTTTSTTSAPITVYIGNVLTSTPVGCNVTVSGELATTSNLTIGQSFRVHFFMKNYYYYQDILARDILISSKLTEEDTVISSLNSDSSRFGGPVTCDVTKSFYVDVTHSNVGTYCFDVNVTDHVSNSNKIHNAFASIEICRIDNMVGGNYSYSSPPAGGCKKIMASTFGGAYTPF